MKILLTNHHLLDYTGSETFTFTIADFLKRKGQEVIVYSKYGDKMVSEFQKVEIPVVTDLDLIKEEKFNLAHVHHNISAYEVRYYFPNLPLVYLSQGVRAFLENPPFLDLNVAKFLATSNGVRDNLIKQGIEAKEIEIFRNMVDSERFAPLRPINEIPKSALIISARLDQERENIIRETLRGLNISAKFIGGRFGWVSYEKMPSHINKADIVFSLGRGAIEAMFCGRVPIIFDYLGGDGMVTPENILEVMKHNFSGKRYRLKFDVEKLTDEIRKYKREHGVRLRDISLKHFDAKTQGEKLVKIYKEAVNDNARKGKRNIKPKEEKTFFHIINIVKETRNYTHEELRRVIDERDIHIDQLDSKIRQLSSKVQELESQLKEKDAQIHQLNSEVKKLSFQLNQIINSRAHRIVAKIGKLRRKFLPKPLDLALRGLASLIVDGPKTTLARIRDRIKT